MNKTENDYSIFVEIHFPRYVKKVCDRNKGKKDVYGTPTVCPEEEKFFEKPVERYKTNVTNGQTVDYIFQVMLKIYSFT